MLYKDESVIKARINEIRKQYSTAETGIYVGDALIEFAECSLLDGCLHILFPAIFQDMPAERANGIYPQKLPQVLKSNQEDTVSCVMNFFDEELDQSAIQQHCASLKTNVIGRLQPATVFYEEGEFPLETAKVNWFSYNSYALDGQHYNLMFLFLLQGRLALGVLNCLLKDSEIWKPVFFAILSSIQIETKEG